MKFKILMPCYNDWSSVFELLKNIDNVINQIPADFEVIIVNDGSSEKQPELKFQFKNINSIDIININTNQGHTRSNATGIKYLSEDI